MTVKCPLDPDFHDCARAQCAFFIDNDYWIGCCVPAFVDALLLEIHSTDQKQP
jgi:hypothetical protein